MSVTARPADDTSLPAPSTVLQAATDRLAARGAGRLRQQSGFLASALVGLGVTAASVWLCGRAGWDPRLSKLVAIVLSFQLTWLLRKHFVFRPISRAI